MFVPKSEMVPGDWKRFAEDGDTWDARGKGRGVILDPGRRVLLWVGMNQDAANEPIVYQLAQCRLSPLWKI